METSSKVAARSRGWYYLFVISWIGILVVPFYNSAAPAVGGFPMFYWYQFALVVASAAITWIVHVATRRADDAQAEEML